MDSHNPGIECIVCKGTGRIWYERVNDYGEKAVVCRRCGACGGDRRIDESTIIGISLRDGEDALYEHLMEGAD